MSAADWIVAHTPGPIVRPVTEVPPLEALKPRALKKVPPGEPFHFAMDVVVEPTGRHSKRAYLKSPVPSGVSFEINSDEGKAIGGDDSAPSPMSYFIAGVAFCLMTHVTGFLSFTSLNVRRIKIEVRGNFMTTMGHVHTGGQGEGGCDSFETYVIFDSDEAPDKLAELVEICERACIAGQTIANAIPTKVNVVVNGKEVAA